MYSLQRRVIQRGFGSHDIESCSRPESQELVRLFLDLSSECGYLGCEVWNTGRSVCVLCHGTISAVYDELSRPLDGHQIIGDDFYN